MASERGTLLTDDDQFQFSRAGQDTAAGEALACFLRWPRFRI
jgi:hypothetical protein